MIDGAYAYLRRLAIAAGTVAMPHIVGSAQAGLLDPQQDAAHLCQNAVDVAETRYALPSRLLYAISEVESGRPLADGTARTPWPWTVQAENQSHYFATKSAAIQWVRHAQAQGISSIDVGCMQVNLLYHPMAFRSLDDAFDPTHNADYAARFLIALHAQAGDWRLAAGQYHSQTVALAVPYRRQVEAMLGENVDAAPALEDSPLQQLQAAWNATLPGDALASKPAELTGNWGSLLRRPAAGAPSRRFRHEPVLLSDAH